VTDDAVAPIRQFQVLPLGNEVVGFRDQRLRQHAAGAFTSKLGQRIVDRVRLTERDHSAISRHGVSLLSGEVLAGSTPASIRRLHSAVVTQIPDSSPVARRWKHARIDLCPCCGGRRVEVGFTARTPCNSPPDRHPRCDTS
jgi:hypothetical protein